MCFRLDQGVANFSVRGQIAKISGFASPKVPGGTTQLCHCREKVAPDKTTQICVIAQKTGYRVHLAHKDIVPTPNVNDNPKSKIHTNTHTHEWMFYTLYVWSPHN